MIINVNEYKLFYKKYKNSIEAAYNCIDSNPSSNISNLVNEKIVFLKKQINELNDWEDNLKKIFIEKINVCIEDLEKIKDSIDVNWKNAELYYKEVYLNLDKLKSNFILLERNLEYLSYDSIDEKTKQELNNKANELNIECNNLCVKISEKIKRLEEINTIKLTISQVFINTLHNNSNNKILNISNSSIYKTNPTSGFNNSGVKFELTTGNKTYNLSEKELNELYAIVASEAAHNPDDALGVISVILNRTESKDNFFGGPNPTPLSIAKANNQFEGYFAGFYKRYLNSNGEYIGDQVIKQAVDDGLNGMRNTNARFFLANWCTYYSDNLITPDGNRYKLNW